MKDSIRSNFDMLRAYEAQLWRLGALAERYFAEDPNTSLLKLRQLSELPAQSLAARTGLYINPEESQYELIRRLQGEGVLPKEVKQILDQIRVMGNAANHALQGDHAAALSTLKLCWQLCLWFHRTFKDADYRSGPFVPPQAPVDESAELRAELAQLRQAVASFQAQQAQVSSELQSTKTQLSSLSEERGIWEQLATESDKDKALLAEQLAVLQAAAVAAPATQFKTFLQSAATAATQVQLDEIDTRRIIDEQLRQAGWEADTPTLRYSKGTRPQRGRNIAIAEWPCDGYSADYVLFQGLTPMAVVEAKRKNVDVSGALQQAKRYSRTFSASTETQLHERNWGNQSEHRIPFVFSANGRPYLRQLATKSGIWFCDLRQTENRSQALDGWYSPDGLKSLLQTDADRAHKQLDNTALSFGFSLWPHQKTAIRETEKCIGQGQREILLAMATGTGKTKTCIALIYRLLKAQRFRRILFLVDRSALGEQATMQGTGDMQMALMFLLGLDWQIARDWQAVRDREKTLDELKKAAGTGAFGSIIGKAADLRTQLTLQEACLKKLYAETESFQVLPEYRELEVESAKLTRQLNELANANTIDFAAIRVLEGALASEIPPDLEDLQAVYQEAGVALPDLVKRRYEDVKSFHQSVVRNRKDYLSSELEAAKLRIELRDSKKAQHDQRRAEIMGILRSHGALDQFLKLQGEIGRLESEVESLRQRFEAAEQLERTKNELEIERNRLTIRLRRDFAEQNDRLAEAIVAFEETSQRLYESAGSITVDETSNGPMFKFPMQGQRSKGIKNMQIFCFDMMLMRLCAKRQIGPRFLIHDSHLFDGVDGRQVISALRLGSEISQELGFQYIVTMNEDDAFKETIEGFDLNDYVLPTRLTDATEDGGLFGIRFG